MQNFIMFHGSAIKNANALYLPIGNAEVSIVDVRNITGIAGKALTQGDSEVLLNKAFTITGPKAISYNQIAEILSVAANKKIEYVSISDEEAKSGMKEAGMDDWLANLILELIQYFRKWSASQVTSTVNNITGRNEKIFDEFANDYADYFRQYSNNEKH